MAVGEPLTQSRTARAVWRSQPADVSLTPNTSIWGNLEQQGDPHPWEAPASWPWETRASL